MAKMSKNDNDQQFTIDNAVKKTDEMFSELNKLTVKSELLLCDLILNFSRPVQADVSKEVEGKNMDKTLIIKSASSSINGPSAFASCQ